MLRQIQKQGYMRLARHPLFYPLLFKILQKKSYLEKKFDSIIQYHAKREKNFFFIQIGANDGMKFDPTYLYVKKYGWKGILVEPVEYIFDKLKKNYRGVSGLQFERVAIGEKNGFKKFYHIQKSEGSNLPLWYDEIGSFYKTNLLRHTDRIPDIEKRIASEEVPVLTFETLLKKYDVSKIDFLQIDAEGHDYHILKQVPFERVKPAIILYEDRHLSEKQKKLCQQLLIKQGYTLVRGVDCLAYIKETI